MAKQDAFYVISYDAAEAPAYGVAWFDNLARAGGESAWTYFDTREECAAHVGKHTRWNPVLLDEGV